MATPAKIGRYEILEELGHGAMGAVYKARDPLMDRTVAVKTILASALAGASAAEYRERFFREARAAGRFNHPGIVTVHDVGEHDGTPFLVMEYITGRTLAAAMEAGERYTFDRIYELGREIAEALGYAHAHGVVHRDVKPANIMLAAPHSGQLASPPRGGPERAKVTDFGVAKLTAAQVTVTGQLLGTPSFMPPEQFTGAPIDGRSDLFSLGVILYWLATGDKPFTGDTITAVSYKIVHTEIVPPRKINPAIPRDFELVVLKLLQKDPALRYSTGEALAEDLAALHAGRTPAVAEATVVTGPHAAARPPRELDPEATMDIDAVPSRPIYPESAESRRRVAAATPIAPHVSQPTPPAVAAPHISTVAQPTARVSRWKNVLLAVLALAVVYLIGRLSGVGPGRQIVQAPTVETAPQQGADTGPKEPPAPADANPAEAQPAETSPSPQPPSREGISLAEKGPIAPEQPGATAAPVPGVPDSEKLNRDVQAFVAQAMKDAANAQRLAMGQQRQMYVQRLKDDPPPPGKSRLIIDASGLPPSLPFAVEVDGAVVFRHVPEGGSRRGVLSVHSQFVEPGQHTIRVHAGFEKSRLMSSNTVTGDFAAPGHRVLTLRSTVEIRPRRAGDAQTRPATRSVLNISLE